MRTSLTFRLILGNDHITGNEGPLQSIVISRVDEDDLQLLAQPGLEPHGHRIAMQTFNSHDSDPIVAIGEILDFVQHP